MNKIPLIIVAGPTASGKSDLAIALARRFGGEIISADSRQVYRGMDIGTGKTLRDKSTQYKAYEPVASLYSLLHTPYFSGSIRHWLLDVASPKRQYAVAQWRREAQKVIRDIVRRGKLPIICGGTGFWIDALVYGLQLPEVKPDAKLRAQLRKLSVAQLYARLKKLDPVRAAAIDRHNPVRLIRALEIVFSTGKPVPPVIRNSPYDILYLAISCPTSKLKRRIEKRLDSRLRAGMVAEVKRLHASGVSWKRLESFGLEYRWLARYLQNNITRTQMRNGLLRDIIRYGKHQMTWWRKNKDIRWVHNRNEAGGLVRKSLLK